jgi:hypothetical protein
MTASVRQVSNFALLRKNWIWFENKTETEIARSRQIYSDSIFDDAAILAPVSVRMVHHALTSDRQRDRHPRRAATSRMAYWSRVPSRQLAGRPPTPHAFMWDRRMPAPDDPAWCIAAGHRGSGTHEGCQT